MGQTEKVIRDAEGALDDLWPSELNRQLQGIRIEDCAFFMGKVPKNMTDKELIDTFYGKMQDIEGWTKHAGQCQVCQRFLDRGSTRPRCRVPEEIRTRLSADATRIMPYTGCTPGDDLEKVMAEMTKSPERDWPKPEYPDDEPEFHAFEETGRRHPRFNPPQIPLRQRRTVHVDQTEKPRDKRTASDSKSNYMAKVAVQIALRLPSPRTTSALLVKLPARRASIKTKAKSTSHPAPHPKAAAATALNALPVTTRLVMETMQWARNEVAQVAILRPMDSDSDSLELTGW